MSARALLFALSIVAVAHTASGQQAAAPAQPPAMGASANLKSPEVSADHGVTFPIAHATDVT